MSSKAESRTCERSGAAISLISHQALQIRYGQTRVVRSSRIPWRSADAVFGIRPESHWRCGQCAGKSLLGLLAGITFRAPFDPRTLSAWRCVSPFLHQQPKPGTFSSLSTTPHTIGLENQCVDLFFTITSPGASPPYAILRASSDRLARVVVPYETSLWRLLRWPQPPSWTMRSQQACQAPIHPTSPLDGSSPPHLRLSVHLSHQPRTRPHPPPSNPPSHERSLTMAPSSHHLEPWRALKLPLGPHPTLQTCRKEPFRKDHVAVERATRAAPLNPSLRAPLHLP